jgi:predicted amino acid racemase
MAIIRLYRKKLKHNYDFLEDLFREQNADWAVVTKLLCGNETFLQEVLDLGPSEVCDSRLMNLKRIKKMRPDIQTVYIKPPPRRSIKTVVKYADVSFNSESETIRLLSEEAQRQNKVHKVTIMIELGDLREGIMGDHLTAFYEKVFHLPNIQIVAIGANLNCMHGVMPSQDKLIQLGLYKQLVEATFGKKIPWVSGGTSVTIPLVFKKMIPKSINHFRIGEALFFGLDLFTGKTIKGMKANVFQLYSEILEITEKPKVPVGLLAENPSGETFEIREEDYGKKSYRAILDIGLLDISPDYLTPHDQGIEVVNASSDMLVVDLGKTRRDYKVGDMVTFDLKYMGALRLINSDYIVKEVIA